MVFQGTPPDRKGVCGSWGRTCTLLTTCGSLWAGSNPHLRFLFVVSFPQLQRRHPDGNHLFVSLWTKPNPSGEFLSNNLKAWHKFGSTEEFLQLQLSNNLFQTQRLNLAWALENIQAKACCVQTVLLSFKTTWKKEGKADISVLQTVQHWLSASTPRPLFPFSLSTWSALRLHNQRFLGNLWTSAMEILSHNFGLAFSFKLIKQLKQTMHVFATPKWNTF